MWLFTFLHEFRLAVSSLQIKHSYMKIYLGPALAWRHETQRAANWFSSCYRSSSSNCFLYKPTGLQINGIVALAQDVGDLILVFVSAINEVRKLPLQSIQKPFYFERIKSRLLLNAVKAAIIKTLRLQVWPQKCYCNAVGIQSFLSALPSPAFIYLFIFTSLMFFRHSIKPRCLQASYSSEKLSFQFLKICY